ncbi:hypothetical protein IB239_01910 [Pseudomonas sp. PDM12]|uniref:hypothetical protein n=1 Tax=Pseudomonas sp. PDM12 TaxID=2769260 RepID=UPI001783AC97|nr:hypothetical protein [Pseudomonas sp. PDM12]MBD9653566.1 hypothetical protein [Pseudomonas sp. PDM12]
MQPPSNPYADWPLHHLLFVKVRDGGGPAKIAHSVAELHKITIEQLKAECRKTGDEWLAAGEELEAPDQRVYEWACS